MSTAPSHRTDEPWTMVSFLAWFRSDAHDRWRDRVPLNPSPKPVIFARHRVMTA